MAAIDFPAAPTVGQLFVAGNGVTYRWNGTLWLAVSSAPVFPKGSMFNASRAANQNIAGGATARLVNWGLRVNIDNAFDPVNGIWTCATAGYYLFHLFSTFSTTVATQVGLNLNMITGGILATATAVIAPGDIISISPHIMGHFNVGEQMVVDVVNSAATAVVTSYGGTNTILSAQYLGPA